MKQPRQQSSVEEAIEPSLLVPGLALGIVSGVLTIVIMVSFAALIFSGELSPHLNQGIGILLFAAAASGIWISLRSAFPSVVAMPQDSTTAIIAPVVAGIAAEIATSDNMADPFSTTVAAIGFSTLVAGTFFLLIGLFRKAGIVRYIPYPVIGGFLAGTGWLLVSGGFQVMTGSGLSLNELASLASGDNVSLWVPGLLLAVITLVTTRRWNHFLLLPGIILAGFLSFYLWLLLSDSTFEGAKAAGALLGPFADAEAFRPHFIFSMGGVDWPLILGASSSLFTVAIVAAVSLLLNSSGLELLSRRDLDLNKELRVAGIANLICGFGAAGPAACHTLSVSSLGIKLNANTRIIGLTAAACCVVAIFLGPRLLSFFPTFLLGGLLVFLGLSFLVEWVVDAFKKLSLSEYGMVWVILIAMNWIGILEGVGIGLALAVVIFVVDYSRIDVVRNIFSGESHKSNVERSPEARAIIEAHCGKILIFQLQGFLFFGSAHRLLEKCRDRLSADTKFCLLDLARVNKMDTSAHYSLEKLLADAESHGFRVFFIKATPGLVEVLTAQFAAAFSKGEAAFFDTLDHALEQAENFFLPEGLEREKANWKGLLRPALADLPRKTFNEGEILIKQGAPNARILFIEAGEVSVQREITGGRHERLKKVRAGALLGELGFFTDQPAVATVVGCSEGSLIYCERSDLEKMRAAHPDRAQHLLEFILRQLSQRTQRLIRTVEILKE